MDFCATSLRLQHGAGVRITYTPSRAFSFALQTPLFTLWQGEGNRASPLLTFGLTATVNGSVFALAGDALRLTIEKEDVLVLPVADDLFYDIVLTAADGFVNAFLGGAVIMDADGSYGAFNADGNASVSIAGVETPVVIQGGGLAASASIALDELNAAVADASASASEAETAKNAAVAATTNKLNLAGDNVGDNAPALRAAIGADLLGNVNFTPAGAGAIVRTAQDKARDMLDVRDFGVIGSGEEGAKIQAALTRASAAGLELVWPSGSYSTGVALVCGAVKIRSTGSVVLTYTGAAHVSALLSIDAAGAETSMLGGWILDGNSKVNTGLLVTNATGRPNLAFGDVEARNCRMVAGNAFNGGANGVAVRGRWNWVSFARLWAENITRAAGSGEPSVFGCIGVEISINGDGAPLHIDGRIVGAKTVTTDDLSGSSYRYDCDGVAVFQGDEDGATCTIGSVLGINCMGRAFKGQVYRALDINLVSVRRSIAPIKDGATEINFQYGEGTIRHVEIEYTGLADTVHSNGGGTGGTTCIGAYTSLDRSAAGYGLTVVENVIVRDLTTGGTSYIRQVLAPQNGAGVAVDQVAILRNAQLFGRGCLALIDMGENGSSGSVRFSLLVDGFMGEIRDTLIRTSATPTADKFDAHVSKVWNTGAEVIAMKRADAGSLVGGWGYLQDGGGNRNISRVMYGGGEPGLLDSTPSRGCYVAGSRAFVTAPLYAGYMVAGTEVECPRFGLTEGSMDLYVHIPESGASGHYRTAPGSTTITAIRACTGVVLGTGAEPASGDFGLWKVAERVYFKNRGGIGDRYAILEAEG